jgi:hypothetical protein
MKYFLMIWPPGIPYDFTELYLLNLISTFLASRTRAAPPSQRKKEIAICVFHVLAPSSGGFRVRNGIFRARFAKRAQAEHTAVADTASAIFTLIA